MTNREELLEIVHPETFKRYRIKNLRVACYEELKVVEFTVVGKNREWPFWAPYDEFKRVNPDLEVPEI